MTQSVTDSQYVIARRPAKLADVSIRFPFFHRRAKAAAMSDPFGFSLQSPRTQNPIRSIRPDGIFPASQTYFAHSVFFAYSPRFVDWEVRAAGASKLKQK